MDERMRFVARLLEGDAMSVAQRRRLRAERLEMVAHQLVQGTPAQTLILTVRTKNE